MLLHCRSQSSGASHRQSSVIRHQSSERSGVHLHYRPFLVQSIQLACCYTWPCLLLLIHASLHLCSSRHDWRARTCRTSGHPNAAPELPGRLCSAGGAALPFLPAAQFRLLRLSASPHQAGSRLLFIQPARQVLFYSCVTQWCPGNVFSSRFPPARASSAEWGPSSHGFVARPFVLGLLLKHSHLILHQRTRPEVG